MGGELLFACFALLRLIACFAATGQPGDTFNLRALLCYLRRLLAWFCLDFLLYFGGEL